MGDGKAKNVIEYLDYLIEKGKATTGAIRPLKIAFAKVMQIIDGENWEEVDVKSIDVDDYMARFGNLTMGKYASESLVTYKSRINKAITWYLHFLDKPGWSPDVQSRSRAVKIDAKKTVTPQKTAAAKSIVVNSDHTAEAPIAPSQTLPTTSGHISYPFPLSDGQLITINLPLQLSKKEAKRIATFIESIAIDEPVAIGPGHE